MFSTARTRAAATALAAVCALTAFSGCSDDDADPDDGLITVTTMRGAFLQASEIGPTWRAPEGDTGPSADPDQMVSFCGGTSAPPQVPPGAETVSSSLADEGSKGAQTLHQTALVYGDAASAVSGQALLKAVADRCAPSVSVPAITTADRNEPAYTETVEVRPVDEAGWSGFVIIRHKLYESTHPGTADTAVAVLNSRNVVLVDTYAVYRLDNASPSPNFENDWKRLLGTVVQRIG